MELRLLFDDVPLQLKQHRPKGLDFRLRLLLIRRQPFHLLRGLHALTFKQFRSVPFDLRGRQGLRLPLFGAGQRVTYTRNGRRRVVHAQPDRFLLRVEVGLFGHLFRFLRFYLARFVIDGLQVGMHGAIVAGQEFDFETAGLLLQRLIRTRLASLTLQRIQLLFDLGHNVAHPHQILLRRFKLAKGFGLLFFVADDTGGFLDQLPAILGRGLQDLLNPPLLDDGMALGPRPGFNQHVSNVFEPAGCLIDEIFAVSVSIQTAGDHQLLIFAQFAWQPGDRIQP